MNPSVSGSKSQTPSPTPDCVLPGSFLALSRLHPFSPERKLASWEGVGGRNTISPRTQADCHSPWTLCSCASTLSPGFNLEFFSQRISGRHVCEAYPIFLPLRNQTETLVFREGNFKLKKSNSSNRSLEALLFPSVFAFRERNRS